MNLEWIWHVDGVYKNLHDVLLLFTDRVPVTWIDINHNPLHLMTCRDRLQQQRFLHPSHYSSVRTPMSRLCHAWMAMAQSIDQPAEWRQGTQGIAILFGAVFCDNLNVYTPVNFPPRRFRRSTFLNISRFAIRNNGVMNCVLHAWRRPTCADAPCKNIKKIERKSDKRGL